MRYDFFLFPVCFRIVVSFAVVVEIVPQGARLSLRDDPELYYKGDCTILFHKNKTQSRDFLSIYFLEITYLWRSLRRHARCFFFLKISLHYFCHKDLPRVYQKQNLALSWFKPASTLSSKCECCSEFEKDLKVFRYSFSETIPIFFIRLTANIVNVLHSKDAKKYMVRINLEKLAKHQNSECCTNGDFWPVGR